MKWLVMAGLLFVGLSMLPQSDRPGSTPSAYTARERVDGAPTIIPPAMAEKVRQQDAIFAGLRLDKIDWQRGGFGAVAIATMTFNNQTEFAVKDIVLTCSFFAPSGTRIHQKVHVVYERIASKKKKTVREVNLGFIPSQAHSATCMIEGAQPA